MLSHPWHVRFQDPATPIMGGIIFFNGLLMAFMKIIALVPQHSRQGQLALSLRSTFLALRSRKKKYIYRT